MGACWGHHKLSTMATFSPNYRHRPTCFIFPHIFKQIQEQQTWTHVSLFRSRFEICLSGLLFFLFYIKLEMIIILFRWRLGSSTRAGKCPGSNLFHAEIVSFTRKNMKSLSPHVNRIRAAIKHLEISCWQRKELFSSLQARISPPCVQGFYICAACVQQGCTGERSVLYLSRNLVLG